MSYLERRPRCGAVVLAAVGALHAAAGWLWLASAPEAAFAPDQRRMVLLQLPTPVAPEDSAQATPARPARPRRERPAPLARTAPTAAAPPVASAPEPPGEVRLLPPDPFAAEGAAPATALAQAKKDAVRFDKEVNQDRLKGITSFEDRPFAQALGGGFKATGTTITEYRSADGRAITKVTTRGRSYCVMALESHSIMSETLGRQGAATRKVNCPK